MISWCCWKTFQKVSIYVYVVIKIIKTITLIKKDVKNATFVMECILHHVL